MHLSATVDLGSSAGHRQTCHKPQLVHSVKFALPQKKKEVSNSIQLQQIPSAHAGDCWKRQSNPFSGDQQCASAEGEL